MPDLKKNIIIFGANSFIARSFISDYSETYSICPVYRSEENSLNLDFNEPVDLKKFSSQINFKIDGVLFLQGINPSMGAKEITEEHFLKMMKVNLSTPTLILASLQEKLAANCLVLLISSVAKRKGSYDPSYAAAKSGLTGLMHSLANAYTSQRFNIISLGLVEGSPVYEGMTEDFRLKHASRMQNGAFIKVGNITRVIDMLINNNNINRSEIAIDGGFQ